ncbi:hypothetical protein BHM03_00025075 [Ensete ventricosum]|nr:hypothetical protein BHM03_00025075 [Ensete ventricosum]
MRCDLPPRHRGSRCHFHALVPPLRADAIPKGGTSVGAAPTSAILASTGHDCVRACYPYRGSGYGRPPLQVAWSPLLDAFAIKMQQEHVEQFYMIQSYDMQFKTIFCINNLGSDTTVGKPQWEHHMRSEN